MESPKEIPMKEMKCSFGSRTPLRSVAVFTEDNQQDSSNCRKNDKSDGLKKEDQELTEACASKDIEEKFHSTPLRVGCCRRKSFQCTDPCCRSNGQSKTPVSNAGRTPLKVPRNPFDAVLLDRLHLPICSPSIFTTVKNEKEDEFSWNIEQQAILFPAPIEEEFHGHHHAYEQYDQETESKMQAAIDRFYESKLIAPSPWTETRKNDFVRGCSSVTKKISENVLSRVRNSDSFSVMSAKWSPTKLDVCTQTQISLPVELPPELESMLQKYKLPTPPKEESCLVMESESFSSSNLRRKLFSHMEEMSITQSPSPQVVEAASSPSHDILSHAFTPDKYGPISPCFHHGLEMNEEAHHEFLESSQTTFWRSGCSPTISPITNESVSRISEDNKSHRKSANNNLHTEFTPPSSRAKHKPFLPIYFAPLLEKEEDYDYKEMKESVKTVISDKSPFKIQNVEEKPILTSEICMVNNQQREEMKVAQENFSPSTFILKRTEVLSNEKSNSTFVPIQQQVQMHDRVYSMEVSDCGTSRTQDTGYQTGNMTNFATSMSLNFSKTRNGLSMPADATSMAEKGRVISRICEDGYMSLTPIKLPLVTEYDDESMCDVWHTTPSPIASSTPAKNITGLLM